VRFGSLVRFRSGILFPLLGILGALTTLLVLVTYQPPPVKTVIAFYLSTQPSGIDGYVVISDRCPPVDSNTQCRPTPAQGRVEIHKGRRDGDIVSVVSAGADGHFRVDLPPGDYSVVLTGPLPPGALYGSWDRVAVRPHSFTEVTLRFENGLQ
jgi:hypothetical protein